MINEDGRLHGKTIAFLVANGFAEAEMTEPQKSLIAEGARSHIISTEIGLVNGWHESGWGHNFAVDTRVNDVLPSQYDALIVPGGERSVATLVADPHVHRVVKGMLESGKPVGMLSQGPAMLIATDMAAGRRVTGDAGLREKMEAAGSVWQEDALVGDGDLVTARGGDDLYDFTAHFIGLLVDEPEDARDAA